MSTRTKTANKRRMSAALAFIGGVLIALIFLIPAVNRYMLRIDRALGDSALFHPGDPRPMDELVFIGIDEDSLTLQGLGEELIASDENLSSMAERFPWNRRIYANMLEKLFEAGARLVVIDLIFSEPSEPEADAELVRVFTKYADRIVIGSNIIPMSADENSLIYTYLEPHPMFLKSDPAPRCGYVNFRPNQEDGIVREARYSTTLNEENGAQPIPGEPSYISLAGAVIEALGEPAPPREAYIRFALEEDRVDEETGEKWGSENKATRIYPPVSARSLFIPSDWEHRYGSGEFFKDKVILIGPAFVRFQDNHQTPGGQVFGSQLHLQAIASGLRNDFVYRPFGEWSGWVFYSGIAGAMIAALLIRWIRRPLLTLSATALVVGGAFLTAWAYARWGATWLGPSPFAITVFFGSVSGQSYDLISERLERYRLNHQFRRFVSRDVADSLVNNPNIYKLAAKGRKRSVVVLFSDIRGFTSLSERVSPEQLFAQLNEYLTAMVKIIFIHKGTLDKFIGDAILAHWGALDDGDESQFATSALAATTDMIEELEKLNADWKSRGLPELKIGIGLHLGDVLAGEIGSEQRTEFGVIGDAVNLASRLEGMTKAFTCPWLSSGTFIEAADAEAGLRRIAKVRVKGREQPIDLWTNVESESCRVSYADALASFETGNFDAALGKIDSHLKDYPDDLVAPHLRKHILFFQELRPTEWDGIIRFMEK